MTIEVQFAKNGFYHPAFGRLGRGDKNRGVVYSLPDFLAEEGRLPKSAKIFETPEELDEALEDNEQSKPVKAKVVDPAELEKAKAAAGNRKPDSAVKRTTGKDAAKRRSSSGSDKAPLN